MTTALNHHASQIGVDGSRSDMAVRLNRGGGRLLVVCFGLVDEWGDPAESARRQIYEWDRRRIGRCVEQPTATHMAGTDAMTYLMSRHNGESLREWRFVRDSWLFGAGILRKRVDPPWIEALGLQSLATWEWIAGSQTTVVTHRAPGAGRKVTEVSVDVTVKAAPSTVWDLIRRVENNRLLHDNCVDAYKVPDTPDGVGEEQAIVLEFPNYRRTVTSIIVGEDPPARLVAKTRGSNDPRAKEIYRLEPVNGGTRLTITAVFTPATEQEARIGQEEQMEDALSRYLDRVERVLARGWPRPAPRFGRKRA